MPSYKNTFQKIHTAVFGVLLLSACASSTVPSSNDYIYRSINFGPDRDADFKQGVQDACRTADGDYTKNHNKFNNNKNYRVGWEDGRIKCQGQADTVGK